MEKKQLKEKQRQSSCLIFEVVPLVGQGSISVVFRKEMVLEKDTGDSENTSSFREADGKSKFQFYED